MLYTDLDYRVKADQKIVQVGITVEGMGSYIAYIPQEEEGDTFLQFVLNIEKKVHEFVILTAMPVIDGQTGVLTEMTFRAKDIKGIQSLEDLQQKMTAEVNKRK